MKSAHGKGDGFVSGPSMATRAVMVFVAGRQEASRRGISANPSWGAAHGQRDLEMVPVFRQRHAGPFTIAGIVGAAAAAAICRHMAQHTTPARMRYSTEKVTMGIHRPGIGVTASDVRIT